MLTNKNVKYLFDRYNNFSLSKGLLTLSVGRSRISEDKITLKEIQNRTWQYLIESLIQKKERGGEHLQIKTKKESKMIKAMETNYKVLRRVYDSIYSNLAKNFQPYLFCLDFSEQGEIENDININGPGITNIGKTSVQIHF